MPILLSWKSILFAGYHRIDKLVAENRANELIRLMKLRQRDQYTNVLSGGMKRGLTIARGMINNPNFFFWDEPAANLQILTWVLGFEILKKVRRKWEPW